MFHKGDSKIMNSQTGFLTNGMYEQLPNNTCFPVTYRFEETLINNLTPAHWHEHIELLCIRQKKLRVYIQGNVIDAAPGDLVIINPGETHAIPEREKGSRYECCIPHKILYGKLGIPVEDHPITNHIQNKIYADKFHKIMMELRKKPDFYEINVQLSLLQLILELIRNYPKDPETARKAAESSKECLVKDVIRYIQNHYPLSISTNDICRYIGFDKSYICRTFKEITGTTIISYLNMIRCEHAKELLQIGKLTVAECASLSGFQHFPYFTKTYKRYIGELPSETLHKIHNPHF